jgi:hypothetical protein
MSDGGRMVLALVMAVAAPAAGPKVETAPSVTVRTTRGTITLSEADARSLDHPLHILFQSCSLNSIDDPEVFRHLDPAQLWAERSTGPHVTARFATPLEIELPKTGGTRQATEVLIPLRADYWLARHGDSILIQTKCGGTAQLLLECTRALRPHLRPDERLCRRVEESVRSRPRP